MTGPTRKLTVIVAALVCLIVAGAAGALIRSTVFTITPGNWARLSGTGLYCRNVFSSTKLRSFFCNSTRGPGSSAIAGSYYIGINQNGVTVARAIGTHGGYTTIRSFINR
jgi:hypothetical protein